MANRAFFSEIEMIPCTGAAIAHEKASFIGCFNHNFRSLGHGLEILPKVRLIIDLLDEIPTSSRMMQDE